IASAAGLMMILVAILESVTPGEVVSTSSSSNTLLLAITLILVGSPVWWFFWRRIESHVAVDGHEQSSPTRRIFLLTLFGVSAIASVISVLTGVFLFLDDLLNTQLGVETLRQMRYAVAILISNAAISWYHLPVDGEIAWDRAKVIDLINSSESEEIMILNEKKKLRAIPFHRN
ncbi:MAG: hypothetical protein EB102_11970, partial [Gammaproteobacteria bacterium]|nr:hypothetical protein [Gammaproteobacteria bacterium]